MGKENIVKKEDVGKKKYKYYEIKVSIRDTKPLVWRRLQIPSGITFHELNAIIQLAFGWCGYHLYSFEVGATLHQYGLHIEEPSDESFDMPWEFASSYKEKIDKYFERYKKIKYVYDFGDDWLHDIVIEKEIYTDKKLKYPVCIKAKMANLPEDCGGPYGYIELLEILDGPKNEEYKDLRKWLDGSFFVWNDDRTYVDIDNINEDLKDYKEHAEFLKIKD